MHVVKANLEFCKPFWTRNASGG